MTMQTLAQIQFDKISRFTARISRAPLTQAAIIPVISAVFSEASSLLNFSEPTPLHETI